MTIDNYGPSLKPLESYRDEFPVTKNYVYLDHAGVAPVSLSVKRAIEEFIIDATDNGAFNYTSWTKRVEEIRKKSAALIGAEPEEVAFVKNTSHGISIVAEGIDWREGDNLIVYEKEFPSNVYSWLNLEKKGVEVRFISSHNGRILIEDIERLIDLRTRLITVSSVQFSNGFRINLKNIGELCRGKGIFFFVDAIQSLGVIPMDVEEFCIDFLAADGHKWLLSPEGTGIFYCREEIVERIKPILIGWKSVQNESDYDRIAFELKANALRFEEGSLNFMGISALGASIDLILEARISRIENRVLELGDLIIKEAEKRGLHVRTPRKREERAGIVSIVGNFDPVIVKDRLRSDGIIVNVRGGAIRVSPHFYNTERDILRLFDSVDRLIKGDENG